LPQSNRLALGAVLVLFFNIDSPRRGCLGMIAALSVKDVCRYCAGLGAIVRKAPYGSSM
jgi:hypothetical protein